MEQKSPAYKIHGMFDESFLRITIVLVLTLICSSIYISSITVGSINLTFVCFFGNEKLRVY